jgi:Na+-driven multidrug efflux pump
MQATLASGLLLSFRTLEFMMSVGILRAGGDARWLFVIQALTLWGFGVPLIFVVANLGWPPITLYLVVLAEEILRDLLYFIRYRTGRWIKQV